MATLHDFDKHLQKASLLLGSEFLRAYLECSDAIQAHVRELVQVLHDPETDEDDRDSTLFTLLDTLYPEVHTDPTLDLDLLGEDRESRALTEAMDADEATFATRLRFAMEKAGLTQEALAKKVGVGQPAISNMLNRACRPQQRTVQRLASALGVPPEDLWPNMKADEPQATA